jgi:hypothetical protein
MFAKRTIFDVFYWKDFKSGKGVGKPDLVRQKEALINNWTKKAINQGWPDFLARGPIFNI